MQKQSNNERGREIYALTDIAPETQAYALARYSRSSASLRDSVVWITEQKAADFLETFYFAYGHKSIADMAHVTLALENISILAAIEVEDEQLWDGQERSTRYQDFTKSGFVVPSELEAHPTAKALFVTAAESLFESYRELTKEVFELLTSVLPRPTDMDAASYKRTLNARALDVTRTLLPYAACTSVGQVTSARVLERQLSRLMGSRYAELQEVADQMREACTTPAFSPVAARVQSKLAELSIQHPEACEALQELASVFDTQAPAPTLVKYTKPSERDSRIREVVQAYAAKYLAGVSPARSRPVQLIECDEPIVEAVATLFYRYSALSYKQVQIIVRSMPGVVLKEFYSSVHSTRGAHDGWTREQQTGYGVVFDILLDGKAMQDFFRHRRCTQIRQEITTEHGFVAGDSWFRLGLPVGAALEAAKGGLPDKYNNAMRQAAQSVKQIAAVSESASHYLVPLGYKRRALFKMDAAQAAYMIETRSQVLGHFAYRQAACDMHRELARVEPDIAAAIRVVPFEQVDFLKR